jgi:hypothetical protein
VTLQGYGMGLGIFHYSGLVKSPSSHNTNMSNGISNPVQGDMTPEPASGALLAPYGAIVGKACKQFSILDLLIRLVFGKPIVPPLSLNRLHNVPMFTTCSAAARSSFQQVSKMSSKVMGAISPAAVASTRPH